MSTTPTPPTQFTLRDLPLPAKLVITCFLLAVGGGYFAAMVQLHFQDSKSGEAMPTVHDVVLKFTGKKWFETDPPRPVSKLEKLVMGPIEGAPWNGTGSMAPAFFHRDGGEFNRFIKEKPDKKPEIEAQRRGEQEIVTLWMNEPAAARKKAYEEDKFSATPDKAPKAITEEFKHPDGSIKVKSILADRCARCHAKGADQEKWPLENYEQVAKYLAVSETVTVPVGGGWVKIEEPIGLEKLTQSTHAHLLSFAVLFSLTGLVFAFTSYPASVRCILGPWVLLAIVSDVSLWWVARLWSAGGHYAAMAIIGTGGAAGLGLATQITLSLFDLYGRKGKIAIVLIFLLGGVCVGLVFMNQIGPNLKEKQDKLNAPKTEPEKKPNEVKTAELPKADPPKNDPPKKDLVVAATGGFLSEIVHKASAFKKNPVVQPVVSTRMEKVFRFPVKGPDGLELTLVKIPFKGNVEGGMVRSFFDKDAADYADAVKAKDKAILDKLTPERHGEMAAFQAWTRLTDVERKKSYEMDAFDLPPTLRGKPITETFLVGGKVKVKTLITDRCVRCHDEGGDAEKFPFKSYENLHEFMIPGK